MTNVRLGCVFGCAMGLVTWAAGATNTVLYSTGFEAAEGYNISYTLSGQPVGGSPTWLATENAANGLMSGQFTGMGQQAYIGAFELPSMNGYLNVWWPINLETIPTNYGAIKFGVTMAIIDSENGEYDAFQWTLYNTLGQSLFSLDFDNTFLTINYVVDSDSRQYVYTGHHFTNGIPHQLTILMDFPQNRWHALLDGTVVVDGVPMTTRSTLRNLGDMDAVWFILNPVYPGDNFMLFDNYRVEAEPALSLTPPGLQTLGYSENTFRGRINGEKGARYALDVSTNLPNWVAVSTNLAPDGTVDFEEPTANLWPQRFYRARLVP